jgi:hypothetical protein
MNIFRCRQVLIKEVLGSRLQYPHYTRYVLFIQLTSHKLMLNLYKMPPFFLASCFTFSFHFFHSLISFSLSFSAVSLESSSSLFFICCRNMCSRVIVDTTEHKYLNTKQCVYNNNIFHSLGSDNSVRTATGHGVDDREVRNSVFHTVNTGSVAHSCPMQ